MNKRVVTGFAVAASMLMTAGLLAQPERPRRPKNRMHRGPGGQMPKPGPRMHKGPHGGMPGGPRGHRQHPPHFGRPEEMVKHTVEFYQKKIDALGDETKKTQAQILLNELRITQIDTNEKEFALRKTLGLPIVPPQRMHPGKGIHHRKGKGMHPGKGKGKFQPGQHRGKGAGGHKKDEMTTPLD